MEKLIQNLKCVNWDFSDYNSIKFPLDINSIPWYPATFPTPIPKFLISLLTKPGDIVLDPFGGKGTTAVEAIKQRRKFYYNDLNPFACDIAECVTKIIARACEDEACVETVYTLDTNILKQNRKRRCNINSYQGKNEIDMTAAYEQELAGQIAELGINKELLYWYHADTLQELLSIFQIIISDQVDYNCRIRKLAFISVLKEVCSQRGHFTYVTDNCRPNSLIYYSAIDAYLAMLKRLDLSIKDLLKQYRVTETTDSLLRDIGESRISCGDSRQLKWIEEESIDFVLTSPPYLCAQDYIRTMRLINFFFPEARFQELSSHEIGARCKRRGKKESVIGEFYSDMDKVVSEIKRVLRKDAYFCLIIGQGKGKITEGYDTIQDITHMIEEKYEFENIFQRTRNISFKSVRIGGVDSEDIIVFRKK